MSVSKFEELIAGYFGAPYAVAVDCCTHAIELCLRHLKSSNVSCPAHTYLSVPMTFQKLNLNWKFHEELWKDYYFIRGTPIVDAAVLWKENSYISGTFMCISFQFKKHLNLGRGGIILLDDHDSYISLKKMRYDGRTDNTVWAEQDVETFGYHYYMTPETAQQGIEKFHHVKDNESKAWSYENYPDLRKMTVFKNV